jgi:hypothetical protein
MALHEFHINKGRRYPVDKIAKYIIATFCFRYLLMHRKLTFNDMNSTLMHNTRNVSRYKLAYMMVIDSNKKLFRINNKMPTSLISCHIFQEEKKTAKKNKNQMTLVATGASATQTCP